MSRQDTSMLREVEQVPVPGHNRRRAGSRLTSGWITARASSITSRCPTSRSRYAGPRFRGRDDVDARRFESRTTGNSGYAPACANEWVPGICETPRPTLDRPERAAHDDWTNRWRTVRASHHCDQSFHGILITRPRVALSRRGPRWRARRDSAFAVPTTPFDRFDSEVARCRDVSSSPVPCRFRISGRAEPKGCCNVQAARPIARKGQEKGNRVDDPREADAGPRKCGAISGESSHTVNF